MGTVADKLARLNQTKAAIRAALDRMGVTVADDDTFYSYADLIRSIRVGDLTKEVFLATAADPTVPYSFYIPGESVQLADMVSISGMNRIGSLKICLTAEESGQSFTVTAPGWTVSTEDKVTSISKTFAPEATPYEAEKEIAKISVTAASYATAAVTVSATGADSGTAYAGTGSGTLRFQSNSWAVVEETYPTMAALDAANVTWAQLEALGKPGSGGA